MRTLARVPARSQTSSNKVGMTAGAKPSRVFSLAASSSVNRIGKSHDTTSGLIKQTHLLASTSISTPFFVSETNSPGDRGENFHKWRREVEFPCAILQGLEREFDPQVDVSLELQLGNVEHIHVSGESRAVHLEVAEALMLQHILHVLHQLQQLAVAVVEPQRVLEQHRQTPSPSPSSPFFFQTCSSYLGILRFTEI